MGSIENTLPLNPMVKVTFLAKPKSGLNPSKVQTSLHHGEHGHLSQYLPQVLPQDMVEVEKETTVNYSRTVVHIVSIKMQGDAVHFPSNSGTHIGCQSQVTLAGSISCLDSTTGGSDSDSLSVLQSHSLRIL